MPCFQDSSSLWNYLRYLEKCLQSQTQVRRRIIRNFTYINLQEIKNGIQDQIFAPLYIVMILQVNMRGNVQ